MSPDHHSPSTDSSGSSLRSLVVERMSSSGSGTDYAYRWQRELREIENDLKDLRETIASGEWDYARQHILQLLRPTLKTEDLKHRAAQVLQVLQSAAA